MIERIINERSKKKSFNGVIVRTLFFGEALTAVPMKNWEKSVKDYEPKGKSFRQFSGSALGELCLSVDYGNLKKRKNVENRLGGYNPTFSSSV